ncbi:MAG: ammonia-forming cytochrome c nitrite reductase subunit c552 [Betaproteobacteria bacterium]|nr:ammonia-forming cytochrome c nitrite reductase subunit c552 [Betaproteobacteria bacterium]
MNKRFFLPILVIVALGLLLAGGCSDVETELKTPKYKTGLAEKELSNAAIGKAFPQQYKSYQQNDESTVMTVYKGSVPFNKNDNVDNLPEGYKYAQPYLKNLWLGYPFMYEYREARGHTHAVEDFTHIDRINRYAEKGGLPATCWNCKTPKMMEWVAKDGDNFWSKDVNEFRGQLDSRDHTIGCANCHNPTDMSLRLYSVPLKDWLKRSGQDESKLTRNEMRSLVCAQCHVEYYFTNPTQGPAAKPVFPWDNGFNPEDMYQYYKTHGKDNAPFADWVHPISKTPMIKMQHPEYETWRDGPHGAAGVSCADCHMPYQKGEDKKKMSSHWWTSPLKDPELHACRQCHADKSADYLKERVLYTQKKTFDQLLIAEETSVKAHEAVHQADAYTGAKAANFDKLMAEAREMIRKGQLFWDYVSAENSVGFHNPAKALDTLASSIQFSQRAVDLACQATNFGISPLFVQDIKTLVPPIVKMSRKLQQDPAYLQSHPWLKVLPVFPAADLMWDGQKKIATP